MLERALALSSNSTYYVGVNLIEAERDAAWKEQGESQLPRHPTEDVILYVDIDTGFDFIKRLVEIKTWEVSYLIPEPLPRILHPNKGQQRNSVLGRTSSRPHGVW